MKRIPHGCGVRSGRAVRGIARGSAVAQDDRHRVHPGGSEGLVISAFDYETDICPEGYSRHTYPHQPTQCVYVSPDWPFDTNVRDATSEGTFTRPKLAWAGSARSASGWCC